MRFARFPKVYMYTTPRRTEMADYNHFHKPDVLRISLMWDPSSYSGFEYNVGMIYTIDGSFMLAVTTLEIT